ncbi:MAG: hypothetical protein LLF75_11835 [Eubacteriales bacterium]|nr:hypothetical protein [Eubacteriales bacterium]
MQTISLPRLRAEAKRQLNNYRKNTARIYRCPALRAEGGAVFEWIRAIDAARAYFRATNPTKERFMSRLFGLDTPIPRNQHMRARMILLAEELAVSESTLYKWREDLFEIVLYAAIESDLICPFGLAISPEKTENAKDGHG